MEYKTKASEMTMEEKLDWVLKIIKEIDAKADRINARLDRMLAKMDGENDQTEHRRLEDSNER